MYRHNDTKPNAEAPDANLQSQLQKNNPEPAAPVVRAASVEELLEKNLKWSQIIYEQNRKIQHKLLWLAIGSWVRVLIIAVPLVLATILFSPLLRNYYCLLTGKYCPTKTTETSWENVIKLLPLTPAQEEQLKNALK